MGAGGRWKTAGVVAAALAAPALLIWLAAGEAPGASIDYGFAFSLGALLGVGELVSRYRDEPARAITTMPALMYSYVNGVASLGALALVRTMDWTFGTTGGAQRWMQVLVGGLGAMALFRTSLFIVRSGDKDIGVGPSTLLTNLLATADAGVDRSRARARAASVTQALDGVPFSDAREALPLYCFALMQNVSEDQRSAVSRKIAHIESSSMDDSLKVLALGLALIDVVGVGVVLAAASSLRTRILKRGVLGDVYKLLREAVDRTTSPEEKRLDVLGLTLYTAWPTIESWIAEGSMAGWDIRLWSLSPEFVAGPGSEWFDGDWGEESKRFAAAIQGCCADHRVDFDSQGIKVRHSFYSLAPAFHGFRVGASAGGGSREHLLAFVAWDPEKGHVARPHGFYERFTASDVSVRAEAYRELFDNWLEKFEKDA